MIFKRLRIILFNIKNLEKIKYSILKKSIIDITNNSNKNKDKF